MGSGSSACPAIAGNKDWCLIRKNSIQHNILYHIKKSY